MLSVQLLVEVKETMAVKEERRASRVYARALFIGIGLLLALAIRFRRPDWSWLVIVVSQSQALVYVLKDVFAPMSERGLLGRLTIIWMISAVMYSTLLGFVAPAYWHCIFAPEFLFWPLVGIAEWLVTTGRGGRSGNRLQRFLCSEPPLPRRVMLYVEGLDDPDRAKYSPVRVILRLQTNGGMLSCIVWGVALLYFVARALVMRHLWPAFCSSELVL